MPKPRCSADLVYLHARPKNSRAPPEYIYQTSKYLDAESKPAAKLSMRALKRQMYSAAVNMC